MLGIDLAIMFAARGLLRREVMPTGVCVVPSLSPDQTGDLPLERAVRVEAGEVAARLSAPCSSLASTIAVKKFQAGILLAGRVPGGAMVHRCRLCGEPGARRQPGGQ